MHLTIEREPGNQCTISEVQVKDKYNFEVFRGIEQPWRSNKPFASCIPAGLYSLIPWSTQKYKNVWAFYGGEVGLYESQGGARYACLIHIANYASQVSGCLGLGMTAGFTAKGKNAVWNSGAAVQQMRELFYSYTKPEDVITCEIRWR